MILTRFFEISGPDLYIVTRSLNDDFEIKNELKKIHEEFFSYMPRHYKNAKKQIFSWEKLAGNSKFLML